MPWQFFRSPGARPDLLDQIFSKQKMSALRRDACQLMRMRRAFKGMALGLLSLHCKGC